MSDDDRQESPKGSVQEPPPVSSTGRGPSGSGSGVTRPDYRLKSLTERIADHSVDVGDSVELLVPDREVYLMGGSSDSKLTDGSVCACNSVCSCVPVSACACDAVCRCDAVTPAAEIERVRKEREQAVERARQEESEKDAERSRELERQREAERARESTLTTPRTSHYWRPS